MTLRERVRPYMSEKRYQHTLGVERCVRKLASIYLPEEEESLAAAALLHDISKELPYEEHLRLIREMGIELSDAQLRSPDILHAISAAAVIRRDFTEWAEDRILRAISYHTVGNRNMTLFDKLLLISDYIEEGRTYASCVAVREELFSRLVTAEDRSMLLDRTLLSILDHTIVFLVRHGLFIFEESLLLRNSILSSLSQS